METFEIKPYSTDHRDAVIQIAIRAWQPVFARTMNEVPRFVYDAFYPRGWEERQTNDVAALLDAAGASVWLAHRGNAVIGFISFRIHPEDQMGEIHILAVDPDHQKAGVGRMLIEFAEKHIRDEGMKIVMVETTGDSGHEPARRAYEAAGYERWPVVRYFKRLR